MLPTSILLGTDVPEIEVKERSIPKEDIPETEVLLQESRYDIGGVRNQSRADKALAVEMKVHIQQRECKENMEMTHHSHLLQLRLRS